MIMRLDTACSGRDKHPPLTLKLDRSTMTRTLTACALLLTALCLMLAVTAAAYSLAADGTLQLGIGEHSAGLMLERLTPQCWRVYAGLYALGLSRAGAWTVCR